MTSNFSIFEMLVGCTHHSAAGNEHHEDKNTESPCQHQHNCISTFHYILPSAALESAYEYQNNHKLNFAKVVLADPFIEAPFQPPRHS